MEILIAFLIAISMITITYGFLYRKSPWLIGLALLVGLTAACLWKGDWGTYVLFLLMWVGSFVMLVDLVPAVSEQLFIRTARIIIKVSTDHITGEKKYYLWVIGVASDVRAFPLRRMGLDDEFDSYSEAKTASEKLKHNFLSVDHDKKREK
ncbi:MAG: hypothetical protein AAF632_18595 [Bacteroidota bacterium]